MTDCNCPRCQALPTKHRLATEVERLRAALEEIDSIAGRSEDSATLRIWKTARAALTLQERAA